jgi:hypothetical protein
MSLTGNVIKLSYLPRRGLLFIAYSCVWLFSGSGGAAYEILEEATLEPIADSNSIYFYEQEAPSELNLMTLL